MNLGIAETLCDAETINNELDSYNAVSVDTILKNSRKALKEEGCSTLYYKANL